ncbi:Hsp20/alpha crystallin family protein [Tengunoibacter tsumagoiensis]|uniref:Heat-shock protein n=1 Tax=Tengunoibacter tsumagoiensis TaxID=2014871 RepID=A0A401ZVV3_9CHLR|nr:Hsp20/alpha crystallin family protein [Tengunoibacter tsumagoiensis]GCE10912.1 heat-shock protein [Tengunoibacter tsumagoiensis]
MRMRYRYVAYRSSDGAQKHLEQHYRQLLNDALRQNQQAFLHRSTAWQPMADILESPDLLRVKIELAGMKDDEIDVTLYEDALVISGERRDVQNVHEGLNYHEAQIRYGPFRVEVFISTPIMRDAITATYENGMLSVDLPKLSAQKAHSVHIHVPQTKE